MTDFTTNGGVGFDPAEADVGYPREGLPGRTGELARRLQEGADYFRGLQPDELRMEVEEKIRARPLISVAVAATAGFLLGRLLRR